MDQRLEGEFWAPVLAETWGSPCALVVATLVARTVRCLCVTLASPFYRFLARYSGERKTVRRVSTLHTFNEYSGPVTSAVLGCGFHIFHCCVQ